MTTYSILMPFGTPRPEQILRFSALAEWSCSYRLWQGQSTAGDPYQTFAYAAAAGFHMPIGVGVTLMPFRHPVEAALQARTAAQVAGHPIVAGFGPGAISLQRAMLGAPYASQLGATREYLTILKALLGEGTAKVRGAYFSCDVTLPGIATAPVEIGAGVLRPGMARLAGEVADAAITWLAPAAYLRDVVVPQLQEGAELAGRPRPRLIAMVPVALSGFRRNGVELAIASNAGHLQLPHYRDMLRKSGIVVDPTDLPAACDALIANGAFVFGTVGEVVAKLGAYADAGVDEIVVNVTGVTLRFGIRAALADLAAVLGEVS